MDSSNTHGPTYLFLALWRNNPALWLKREKRLERWLLEYASPHALIIITGVVWSGREQTHVY